MAACSIVTKFSLDRPLASYTKVQALYALLVRNRAWQAKRHATGAAPLLNLGCGPFPSPGFVNLDYCWRPGVDVCWDFRKPLPFAAGSAGGAFSEHCLEHLARADAERFLGEVRRILKPGAWFRLAIPDAELYLSIYQKRRAGEAVLFPYEEALGADGRTAMDHVNRIFRDQGHLFAYDFETLAASLRGAGFATVERRTFRQGQVPSLLIDQESRHFETLYVEARSRSSRP